MKLNSKVLKCIFFLVSLALLLGCATTSEPIPFHSNTDKYAYVKEYMHWYIKEQMDENDIVGMSVALVDDQKIVWQEGFGYEDKEKGIKATPKTRYRAGSITKLFNAMAVMKLAEERKMNIDKPLKKYLSEFSIKSRFGSINNITPRNIMTHHSGLPSDWLDRMFATHPLPYTEYVNVIQNEYVAYKPNTIMSYSNLGVTLLGHSVEKVSGMKYANYINKVLLTPMGMKNSEIKMVLNGKHASKSYEENEETNEYAIGELPAGGLNTSVEELSHLAMMINTKGMYKKHRILKSMTLNKMFKVQNKHVALDVGDEMGLGFFIDHTLLDNKDVIYHHGGDTVAQHAFFAVAPRSKLGVVVMTNSAEANAPEIAKELMKKAWEAKTGKKVKAYKLRVKHDSDFSGVYATILGKVEIVKSGKDTYNVKTEHGTFTLSQSEGNVYKAKYKILGILPIGIEDLDKVSFYTDDIEGHHVIVASLMGGMRIVGGLKVKKHLLPKKWKAYIGHYRILNNFEEKTSQIKDTEFYIEDGYALIKIVFNSGDNVITMINPINDTEAIIEGLGRGMQETVYMKDGIFYAYGLRFEKTKL